MRTRVFLFIPLEAERCFPYKCPSEFYRVASFHSKKCNGERSFLQSKINLSQEDISSFNALEDTRICAGYEASLEVISEAESSSGPFDGILGFSQGAAMVGLYLAAKHQSTFKFVIYVASFKSKSEPHQHLYDGRARISEISCVDRAVLSFKPFNPSSPF